jgi:hypothetical protein
MTAGILFFANLLPSIDCFKQSMARVTRETLGREAAREIISTALDMTN